MSQAILNIFGYTYEHDILNEINKFRDSYHDIWNEAGDPIPDEESFKLFKVCVGTKENEKQCVSGLERGDNIVIDDQFDDLSDSLFDLTLLIEEEFDARLDYCFFTYSNTFTIRNKEKLGFNLISNYSSKVARKNNCREHEVCIYPNSISARYALTWVLIYKLCKKYYLDKNRISNIVMELVSNTLQIHIFIGDEWVHEFSFNTVDRPNILALNKWVYCGCHHYTDRPSKVNYIPPVPEGTHVYGAEFMDVYEYDQQLMYVHNKKEKDNRMKKMLKLMLISQMMNSQK